MRQDVFAAIKRLVDHAKACCLFHETLLFKETLHKVPHHGYTAVYEVMSLHASEP
jgi:hypothetical protein